MMPGDWEGGGGVDAELADGGLWPPPGYQRQVELLRAAVGETMTPEVVEINLCLQGLGQRVDRPGVTDAEAGVDRHLDLAVLFAAS